MITITIRKFIETHTYSPIMNEILKLSQKNSRPFYELNELLVENNLTRNDIKQEALDVFLDLIEMVVQDDCIIEDEIQSVHLLKMYLGIEENEFKLYDRMERVKRIITEQMEQLYTDNTIDYHERIYKSKLQGLFGLGYDEFQEIVDKVELVAYARGAEMKDLDTFLDYGVEL